MKSVVTFGGGNAHAITLRTLKKIKVEDNTQFDITAIVSVADSGGSSGRLRKEFGILPPGDLLRATMALSSFDFLTLRHLFYELRFVESSSSLEGHNIGNLLLKQLCDITGSMKIALEELGKLWNTQGKVLPVTLDKIELCAQLQTGEIVRGETNIDMPQYDPKIHKTNIFLEPKGSFLPEARKIVESADYIILGPGDLFTSIIPCLLVGGVYEAIARSKAKISFIVNLANRLQGETRDFTALDYIQELQKHLPRACDMIIAHERPDSKHLFKYEEKGWQWIQQNADKANIPLICGDLENDINAGMDYLKLYTVLKQILL